MKHRVVTVTVIVSVHKVAVVMLVVTIQCCGTCAEMPSLHASITLVCHFKTDEYFSLT